MGLLDDVLSSAVLQWRGADHHQLWPPDRGPPGGGARRVQRRRGDHGLLRTAERHRDADRARDQGPRATSLTAGPAIVGSAAGRRMRSGCRRFAFASA